jgi:hypothetical protein
VTVAVLQELSEYQSIFNKLPVQLLWFKNVRKLTYMIASSPKTLIQLETKQIVIMGNLYQYVVTASHLLPTLVRPPLLGHYFPQALPEVLRYQSIPPYQNGVLEIYFHTNQ